MCAPICEAPEDVAMTCDDCKMGIQAKNINPRHQIAKKHFQAALDQLLSPEALDIIVEGISAELCKDNPTPECPAAVDGVIRQGQFLYMCSNEPY